MNNLNNTFTIAYIIKKLTEPLTDSTAYKTGLINEKGDMLRTVSDTDEFNPIDAFVLKLRKLLGPKIDLLHNEIALQYAAKINIENISVELFEKEIIYFNKINNILQLLEDTVSEAESEGLDKLTIEKIIFEKITKK